LNHGSPAEGKLPWQLSHLLTDSMVAGSLGWLPGIWTAGGTVSAAPALCATSPKIRATVAHTSIARAGGRQIPAAPDVPL
jgi:hypothetical protein